MNKEKTYLHFSLYVHVKWEIVSGLSELTNLTNKQISLRRLTSRSNCYFNTDLVIGRVCKGMFLVLYAGRSWLQKGSEFSSSYRHRAFNGLSRKPGYKRLTNKSSPRSARANICEPKQVNIKVNNDIVQLLLYSHLLFNTRI